MHKFVRCLNHSLEYKIIREELNNSSILGLESSLSILAMRMFHFSYWKTLTAAAYLFLYYDCILVCEMCFSVRRGYFKLTTSGWESIYGVGFIA